MTNTERIKIDIKDLNLEAYMESSNTLKSVVSYSKHLCGCATDLTLRCLSKIKDSAGIVIALCCHQVCNFDMYVNRDFLEDYDISRNEFDTLCSMSSWALCENDILSEIGV